MMRIAAVALAVIAPFLFPWPLALVLAFAGAAFVPLLAPLLGILVDSVYWIPGATFPYATLLGLIGFPAALAVHRFMKTRIMAA
ncbi:MAG TPA: hypothetical protein VHO23_03015 [Candidatus Paceibacterota bacterium]|nr:hypothetical protein [Candidatus Paceibacterota bacterium]